MIDRRCGVQGGELSQEVAEESEVMCGADGDQVCAAGGVVDVRLCGGEGGEEAGGCDEGGRDDTA